MLVGYMMLVVGVVLIVSGIQAYRHGNDRERQRVTKQRRYYDR